MKQGISGASPADVVQIAVVRSLKLCYSAILRQQRGTFQWKELNKTEEQRVWDSKLKIFFVYNGKAFKEEKRFFCSIALCYDMCPNMRKNTVDFQQPAET